jgi:anti-sigma factor RsiW
MKQRERCNLGSVTEQLPRDWWTTRDVASFLNVAPSTIRAYVARHQMPEADRRIGREPVWRPATIRKWHSQRPRHAQSEAEPTR